MVFVTPLRALSAQIETRLQRKFDLLGKIIPALYGSIGTSGFEGGTSVTFLWLLPKARLCTEKRPAILVLLGEGHVISLGEHEVRYEVQIQGISLDDLVDWIRCNEEGSTVSVDWRPTAHSLRVKAMGRIG